MAACNGGLMSLPNETLELVATHLVSKNLLTMRLVCKDAAAKVARQIALESFSELHILLSIPSSLQKAIEVTKHPILRQGVSKVVLYVDHPSENVWHDIYILENFDDSYENPSEEVRAQRRFHMKMYEDLLEDYDNVTSTQKDQESLTIVLQNLRTSAKSFDLVVREITPLTGPPGRRFPKDYTKLKQVYGAELNLTPHMDDAHRMLTIALNAVADCHIRLRSLSIYSPDGNFFVPFTLLPELQSAASVIQRLQGLQHLSLTLRPEVTDVETPEESIVDALRFIEVFAPTLTILKLVQEGDSINMEGLEECMVSFLDGLFDTIFFAKLEILGLWWASVHYHKLVSFLKRHTKTLKRISLEDTVTVEPDYHHVPYEHMGVEWQDFLTRDGLKLTFLEGEEY